MSKISIVTAFYDIGRGDWSTSTEKNGGPLPHYLQRSVDKYIDHFTRMCEIDTEIIVTIMSENMESFLPTNWINTFPSQLTNKDTPFINDIKFIDIIVRPGTCLVMPPHWFISWTSNSNSTQLPMVCMISYHTPISLLAFHLSPFNKFGCISCREVFHAMHDKLGTSSDLIGQMIFL